MNDDLRHRDLATVLAEGALVADEARRAFGRLSAEQINWKPGEGEWSIGQCFDHLIVSNRPYQPLIEEILEGRRRRRAWERVPHHRGARAEPRRPGEAGDGGVGLSASPWWLNACPRCRATRWTRWSPRASSRPDRGPAACPPSPDRGRSA